ncbi:hypothetical protein HX109_04430 [Galbibacter sp. BG1]|uniref:hypothetical protein n=1 Tax=Galbibacter sp. BG1 TaxID=1170699 RepID=UPI0015BE0322|nr:hypothetical protein [Galbibacter sp. BG1]QLE00848.1 hypothetical protein HX109_04430 [Galbibacter sp. BG1]
MAFGAGHVLDMINRMKQNRAQRPSQKAKFDTKNTGYSRTDFKCPKYVELSPEKLKAFQLKIRTQAHREKRKEHILFAAFGFIGLVLLLLLYIILQ